jgi:GNAT superfamily N-acetyltransferase
VSGSINFGLYDAQSEQRAYARIVSDRATFAWLCDVYVDRAARGAGLGTWFVSAVCEEAKSWGLRRIVLATLDAHGLYEKLGFTGMTEPERWMERWLAP